MKCASCLVESTITDKMVSDNKVKDRFMNQVKSRNSQKCG